jgi:hypothetical protein
LLDGSASSALAAGGFPSALIFGCQTTNYAGPGEAWLSGDIFRGKRYWSRNKMMQQTRSTNRYQATAHYLN